MQSSSKNFQQAKQAARRLFKRVNFEGNNLQPYQVNSLLQQTYQSLNIIYKPTSQDVKQYSHVLDANGDGLVSLQDLQTMAVNYLCGEGVLGSNPLMGSATSLRAGRNQQLNTSSANYTPKFEINTDNQSNNSNFEHMSQAYRQQNNAWYGNLGHQKYNSEQFKSTYQNNSTVGYNNTLSSNNGQNFNREIQTQDIQSANKFSQKKYTSQALSYLEITRKLFKKHANPQSHTITKDKVAPLLNETYAALGRKGYHPNEEDVNVWMKLCDTNSDGHVQQAEYEYFVIRALERSGVKTTQQ